METGGEAVIILGLEQGEEKVDEASLGQGEDGSSACVLLFRRRAGAEAE